MNCPKCNAEIQQDDAFCNSCGNNLSNNEQQVSTNTVNQQGTATDAHTWLKYTYIAHMIGLIFPFVHLVAIILTMLKKSEAKGEQFIMDHYSYTFSVAIKGGIGMIICSMIGIVGSVILVGPIIAAILGLCIWIWTIIKYVKGWKKFDNAEPINA